MVDYEPFLDAPFESASNLSFELLLISGIVLLGVVAYTGRTTATVALVCLYLLAIPWYVALRARTAEGGADEGDDDRGEPDDEGSEG